jgi:CBS domain-containing protein
MAVVKDILARKGSAVFTVSPEATVLEAARLMNEHRVGALLVTADDRVVGMFTERDVLRRIVAEDRAPARTPVAEVMTTEVLCCDPQTSLAEARSVMKNRRIRHLPVVEEGNRLLGLISIGDLNAHEARDQEVTIHYLEEYLYGRV